MIRRILSALARGVVDASPAMERKAAMEAHAGAPQLEATAAGPLPRRVPAWADTTPLGVARRRTYEVAEMAHLQADRAGMHAAHLDLLYAAGKSGAHIPDVLGLEASAYLDGATR